MILFLFFFMLIYSTKSEERDSELLYDYDGKNFNFSFFIYGLLLHDEDMDFENIYQKYFQGQICNQFTLFDSTLLFLKNQHASRSERFKLFFNNLHSMFSTRQEIIKKMEEEILENTIYKKSDSKNKLKSIFKHFVEYVVFLYKSNNIKIFDFDETNFLNCYYIPFTEYANSNKYVYLMNYGKVQTLYKNSFTLYMISQKGRSFYFLYIPFELFYCLGLKTNLKNNLEDYETYKKSIKTKKNYQKLLKIYSLEIGANIARKYYTQMIFLKNLFFKENTHKKKYRLYNTI